MDYEGAAFPKGARKRDKKLLREVKGRPCLVCFKRPTDPHHVQSRGAGGDDSEGNVVALCRSHHREIHRIGVDSFAERYQAFRAWREAVRK